jgi:flagellar protein FliO/FliZ
MNMHIAQVLFKRGLSSTLLTLSSCAYARSGSTQNSGADLLQVALGLLIVLIVIIALAWAVKKMSYLQAGGKSVAHIVGAVSVGTRERVVVLEIANRWIVVGVASGHVSAIANLDIETIDLKDQTSDLTKSGANFMTTLLDQLTINRPSSRNKDE